jgi:tetratricopeptide (TPR) repeat protein
VPAFIRAIELGGGDPITYGLLGFAYSSLEKDLNAETAYRMAIVLDPETMDWKMGLARSLFKQQRYADAAALCGQLIVANPDRADLWLLQANAYIGLNLPMKAAENYELVDRLGASTVESLYMLGDIYVNNEMFDLAVDTYIRAMDKAPSGDAKRVIRAAKVMVAHGAFKETRRLIEHIQKVHGDKLDTDGRKDVLKLRARIAVADASGEEEEVQVLEEIVKLDPLDGEALILLGQYYRRSDDPEKAVFYYERAASIDKHEAEAKLRHAQLLVSKGKYAEALPLLRRAQALKHRENVQKYLEQVERIAKTR